MGQQRIEKLPGAAKEPHEEPGSGGFPSEPGIFAERVFDFVCSIGGLFRIPPTSSSRSSFVLLSISFSVHTR